MAGNIHKFATYNKDGINNGINGESFMLLDREVIDWFTYSLN